MHELDEVDQRAAHRPLRRVRNVALVMVPMVALLGIIVGAVSSGSDEATVTADDDLDSSASPSADPTVSVLRTEVVGGEGGTERVVMELDGPLPGRGIRYVDDITSFDAGDEILYTTQEAAGVHVCGTVHWFPPPAEGTVDLLMPADWFADGADSHTGPIETIADPAKFVVCGPHAGYFQYSIWGPASADIADVDITVDPDGRRLTVQISSGSESTPSEPPTIDRADAEAAESAVSAFLEDLRDGDLMAAAERWTGYPDVGPDAPVAERIPSIEWLLADPTFARILDDEAETFVTSSWGWTAAMPVVTLLAPRNGGDPPVAVAFLMGGSEEQGEPGTMWIHRLPDLDDVADPEIAGSFAEPGQTIVVPGVPVEGGARAYVDGREIAVDVDHVHLTMAIKLPDDVEGDVAITLSTAAPELPGARAFALTVSPVAASTSAGANDGDG